MAESQSSIPSKEAILERLKRYVRVDETTGCWEWTSWRGKPPNHYGNVKIKGRSFRVHRLSYEVYIGPIPQDALVLHRCDNPPCCNPEHLFLGTQTDNMADKAEKGRAASGGRNGKAKLTEADVRAIRRAYQPGRQGGGYQRLAAAYGVSVHQIFMIVSRRKWKHVPDDSGGGVE